MKAVFGGFLVLIIWLIGSGKQGAGIVHYCAPLAIEVPFWLGFYFVKGGWRSHCPSALLVAASLGSTFLVSSARGQGALTAVKIPFGQQANG